MRPTEPANSTSPEKRWPSAKKARCAGEWPGTSVTANEMPASVDRLAAVEPDVRRRATDVDSGRRECGGLLDQDPLPGRGVHGCAGLLGEVGEADDVVEVAVRDEDRGAAGAASSERGLDRGGVTARVDDDRLGVASDDARTRYVFVPIGPSSSWSTSRLIEEVLRAPGQALLLLAPHDPIHEVAERDEDGDEQDGLDERRP